MARAREDTAAPAVSVILTTYNQQRWVAGALDSLAAQTFDDFELLVVDDHSTDGSAAVAREWLAAHDLRAELIENERNLGVAATMNRAIAASRGTFVCGHAADDVAVPERIEVQHAVLSATGDEVAAVFSDMRLITFDDLPVGQSWLRARGILPPPTGSELFRALLRESVLPAPAVMVKRAALDAVGPHDESLVFEDYDLWLRLLDRFEMRYVPGEIIDYRVYPESLSLRADRTPTMWVDVGRVQLKWRGRHPDIDWANAQRLWWQGHEIVERDPDRARQLFDLAEALAPTPIGALALELDRSRTFLARARDAEVAAERYLVPEHRVMRLASLATAYSQDHVRELDELEIRVADLQTRLDEAEQRLQRTATVQQGVDQLAQSRWLRVLDALERPVRTLRPGLGSVRDRVRELAADTHAADHVPSAPAPVRPAGRNVVFVVEWIESFDGVADLVTALRAAGWSVAIVVVPARDGSHRNSTGEYFVDQALDVWRELRDDGYMPEPLMPVELVADYLRALRPVAVFLPTPYEAQRHESLHIEQLGLPVHYVNYGLNVSAPQEGIEFDNPFFYHCAAIYTENGYCFGNFVQAGIDPARLVASGHPILDRWGAVYQPRAPEPTVMWCPHWSLRFEGPRGWTMGYSTFLESYSIVLNEAARRPHVHFILRPHPLLWGELRSEGAWTDDDEAAFRARVDALDNVTLEAGSRLRQFERAWAMVTDGVSFVGEFPYTGKPLLLVEGPNTPGWNPIGRGIAAVVERSRGMDGLPSFLDRVERGIDPSAEERRAEVHRYFTKPLGGSAAAIIAHLEQEAARQARRPV